MSSNAKRQLPMRAQFSRGTDNRGHVIWQHKYKKGGWTVELRPHHKSPFQPNLRQLVFLPKFIRNLCIHKGSKLKVILVDLVKPL
jgi:hypothetical protein